MRRDFPLETMEAEERALYVSGEKSCSLRILCLVKLSLENESEIKHGKAFQLRNQSEIIASSLLKKNR